MLHIKIIIKTISQFKVILCLNKFMKVNIFKFCFSFAYNMPSQSLFMSLTSVP